MFVLGKVADKQMITVIKRTEVSVGSMGVEGISTASLPSCELSGGN
jgi:hypothetical protein